MVKNKTIYGIDKMAYILYKLEGVDYDTKINGRNKIIFLLEDTNELNDVCDKWDKVQDNISDETINLSKYLYLRRMISDTIKISKR